MAVFSKELTVELCQQRSHVQVSGTGRYFIDLLLKELEKSAAFFGIKMENVVVKILNFREKMTHPLLEKHHYLQKFYFLVK